MVVESKYKGFLNINIKKWILSLIQLDEIGL